MLPRANVFIMKIKGSLGTKFLSTKCVCVCVCVWGGGGGGGIKPPNPPQRGL